MAGSWIALTQQVNDALARIEQARSEASGAAATVLLRAQEALEAARDAAEAAAEAEEAATNANNAAAKWNGATAAAETLDAGENAKVELKEVNGVKHFEFELPEGPKGDTGPKGDVGVSGVTFRMRGTALYITTNTTT
jgi:regulator of protease activity HflC (stomatin/prohibitin superfamily)